MGYCANFGYFWAGNNGRKRQGGGGELRLYVRQNPEVTGALSPVANGWQTDGKYFGQGEESRLFAAV